jgi:hypothetical protein
MNVINAIKHINRSNDKKQFHHLNTSRKSLQSDSAQFHDKSSI